MQTSFKLDDDSGKAEILKLADDQLLYLPRFIAPGDADAMLATLLSQAPWQQDYLTFGGRKVAVPRLQAWYGDNRSHYGYSGLRLRPLPWTPLLTALRKRAASVAGASFNSVLLNLYRNGKDSVAWHADDEPELGRDPVIASISLGVTRRFELKHLASKRKAVCDLEHGSLLVMGHGIQHNWQHQVPKQPEITGSRINLTFRQIIT